MAGTDRWLIDCGGLETPMLAKLIDALISLSKTKDVATLRAPALAEMSVSSLAAAKVLTRSWWP